MINIYRVKFKTKDNKIVNFTSLDALYTKFSRDDIGVGKGYLYQVFYKQNFFDNAYVHIDKEPAYNKKDIENNNFPEM